MGPAIRRNHILSAQRAVVRKGSYVTTGTSRRSQPQRSTLTRRALSGALLALLGACGGGGSGSSDTAPAPPPTPVNQAPTAAFVATTNSGTDSLRVNFDASASTDADGTLSSYAWAFGDNNTGTGENTSHRYDTAGAYTVRLTVTDNDDATDTTTRSINVEAPPPVTLSVSGQIQILASSAVDADVNDVLSVPNRSNNTAELAQPIPVPVSLGGFANLQGTGPTSGRLFSSGDPSDFYSLSAAGGEQISLDVGEHPNADLDLRLWDSAANLIDASVGANPTESLIIAARGDYFLEVVAVTGASTYVLSAGQAIQNTGANRATRLSDAFVPGEFLLTGDSSNVQGGRHVNNSNPTTVVATTGPVTLHQLANPVLARAEIVAQLKDTSSGNPVKRKQSIANASDTADPTTLPMRDHWEPKISNDAALRYATLKHIAELNRHHPGQAEPNFLRHAHLVPNDALYGAHWHYDAINLPLAWDLTTGSSNVVVAVIDTGVLLNHPDFAGQLVPGYDFISSTNRSGDGDGIDPNPDDPGDATLAGTSSFHGTHVAGTVAARTNNASGVAGSGWDTRVMPLRVLGTDGGTSFDILQAVRFAAGLANDSDTVPDQRADIINLSLGGGAFSQSEQNLFNEVRDAGVLVFASAGNESSSIPSYPGAYANVISVSATTINNNLASYSNFGPDIDLAAPGGNTGTDFNGDGIGDGIMSTLGNDRAGPTSFGFGLLNGTSMSAPHVAGVAALMKAVHPALTPQEFEVALINGDLTQDIGVAGRDDQFGFGLLNAQRSVLTALALASGTAADPGPILSGTANRLNFGTFQTNFLVSFANAGTQTLQITGTTSNQTWLSASATEVDANGLGSYAVLVDRTGLADGTYNGRLTIESNSNSQTIDVVMQVTSIDLVANAGTHFIILVDSAGDTVSQSFVNTPQDGFYSFSLTDVPAGEYRLFAGTDLDNDDLLCDAGEACGAYRTLDSPEVFTLDTSRSDLNFVSGFRQNFSGNNTQGANLESPNLSAFDRPPSGLRINKAQLPSSVTTGELQQ